MGQSSFLTAKVAFDSPEPKRDFSNRTDEKTLIIFDWDDTLMCSTFLAKYNRILEGEQLEKAKHLGEKVTQILMKAKRLGNVYIVSNSSYSWILHTAIKFLGMDKSIFDDIDILSCRDCKDISKYDQEEWKEVAFSKLEKNFIPYNNIILIGDSDDDVEPSYDIQRKFPEKNISSIKFICYPSSPKLMEDELDFLAENVKDFADKKYNVDLAKYNFKEKKFEQSQRTIFSIFSILS